MSRIIIEAHSTYDAEDSTIALLKGGFVAQKARITYNLSRGLPTIERYSEYPLILEGYMNNLDMNIYVYSVTAGYGGTGPNTLVRILKEAGFKFDTQDILTDRLADTFGQIKLELNN